MSSAFSKGLSLPSGVENCVCAHFTSENDENLIISKTTVLEIYKILPQATGQRYRLQLVSIYTLYGTIRSMDVIRLPSGRDNIILAFPDAKVSILEWNSETNDIGIVSMHYYEEVKHKIKSGIETYYASPLVRVDPQNRCAAILCFDRYLAIIPFFNATDDFSQNKNRKVYTSYIIVLPKLAKNVKGLVPDKKNEEKEFIIDNVKDFTFLHGYHDPTILILYEPHQTWAGRVAASGTDTCALTAISLNLLQKTNPIIWTVDKLPNDSNVLLSIPYGGALVMCSNSVLFCDPSIKYQLILNHFQPVVVNYYPIEITKDLFFTLDCACFAFLSKKNIIASLKGGELIIFRLEYEGRTMKKISIIKGGASVISSCLCNIGKELLFLGSRIGESWLIEYHEISDEDEINPLQSLKKLKSNAHAIDASSSTMSTTAANNTFLVATTTPSQLLPVVKDESDKSANPASGTGNGGDLDIEPNFIEFQVDMNEAATFYSASAWRSKKHKENIRFDFKHCDSLINIGPISDFTVAHSLDPFDNSSATAPSAKEEIVTASGYGKHGALYILQRGIRPNIVTSFPAPNCVNIWTLFGSSRKRKKLGKRKREAEQSVNLGASNAGMQQGIAEIFTDHSVVLISTNKITIILNKTQDNLSEISNDRTGFFTSKPTINAGNLNHQQYMIQIGKTNIRLLSSIYICLDEVQLTEPIEDSFIYDPYVVLSFNKYSLFKILYVDAATNKLKMKNLKYKKIFPNYYNHMMMMMNQNSNLNASTSADSLNNSASQVASGSTGSSATYNQFQVMMGDDNTSDPISALCFFKDMSAASLIPGSKTYINHQNFLLKQNHYHTPANNEKEDEADATMEDVKEKPEKQEPLSMEIIKPVKPVKIKEEKMEIENLDETDLINQLINETVEEEAEEENIQQKKKQKKQKSKKAKKERALTSKTAGRSLAGATDHLYKSQGSESSFENEASPIGWGKLSGERVEKIFEEDNIKINDYNIKFICDNENDLINEEEMIELYGKNITHDTIPSNLHAIEKENKIKLEKIKRMKELNIEEGNKFYSILCRSSGSLEIYQIKKQENPEKIKTKLIFYSSKFARGISIVTNDFIDNKDLINHSLNQSTDESLNSSTTSLNTSYNEGSSTLSNKKLKRKMKNQKMNPLSSVYIKEVQVVQLNPLSLPYLFCFTNNNDFFIYQAFHFEHQLRFSRFQHNYIFRNLVSYVPPEEQPKKEEEKKSSSSSRDKERNDRDRDREKDRERDRNDRERDRNERDRKRSRSSSRRSADDEKQEEQEDENVEEFLKSKRKLYELNNEKRKGMFIAGKESFFIFCERGYLRLFPMNNENSVHSFANFGSNGFMYATTVKTGANKNKQEINIAEIPINKNYDNAWPIRKISLRQQNKETGVLQNVTPHHICYHPTTKTHILSVSVSEIDMDPIRNQVEESGGLVRYKEKFEIRLYDGQQASNWQLLDKYPSFDEDEHITSMAICPLIYKDPSTEEVSTRSFIIIGTSYAQGEDVTCKGRLFVFDIIASTKKFKLLLDPPKVEKGPISALSAVQGYLILAIGPKILMYSFESGKEFVGKAFYDTQMFIVSIKSCKNYIIVADMFKSVCFLIWKRSEKQLCLLSKDYGELYLTEAEFLVDNNKLGLLVSDRFKNIQILNFDPKNIISRTEGKMLIPAADFHLGALVSRARRIRMHEITQNSALAFSLASGSSGFQTTPSQQIHFASFIATVDGGLSLIAPVDEDTFARLLTLQTSMLYGIPHCAGLNPKAFRKYKPNEKQLRPRTSPILDIDLLFRYNSLDIGFQREFAKLIGSTVDQILYQLKVLDAATSFC